MKKTNRTLKALLSSILALMLCFAMLVGSTFAWFTDSVSSDTNKIIAGNLDVELEYSKVVNGQRTDWDLVEAEDEIFDPNALWEPGRIEVVYLKVSNLGTLALKYKLGVRFFNEVSATNVAGDTFYLSQHLVFKVVEMNDALETYDTYEDAVNAAGTEKGILNYTGETKALDAKDGANDEDYVALIVYMPKEVGNVANYRGTAPSIDLGITLSATQYTAESDSYGPDYDADAPCTIPAATIDEFLAAIENGDNVLLEQPITIDATFMNAMQERAAATTYSLRRNTTVIDYNAVIDGNGSTVYRTEEMLNKPLFTVASGYTLTLSNITLDGGAEWTGEIDPVLLRGTENSGLSTTANIVTVAAGAHLVLNEGAVVQNNDGAWAIVLTRDKNGSSFTLNGGEVINNNATGGAICGGGKITINDGKINYNSSPGISGAIRMFNNNAGNTISFTMNGGEINHNKAGTTGGAVWGGGNAVHQYNGGEIAYNYAGTGGGAIYSSAADSLYFSGDFEMHHNACGASDAGEAIYMESGNTHPVLQMTGGKIYANGDNESDLDIRTWNVYLILDGGELEGSVNYVGGLAFTFGNADCSKVYFNTSRGDYVIHLRTEFGTLEYEVNLDHSLIDIFMLKPADGYTYTEGDEAKLICLNEGYSTYWDAENGVFKIKAN